MTESAAIQDAVSSALSTIDNTFQFKGTIGTGGTVEALPTIHGIGWVFRVLDDSTLAGQQVETGDLLFAVQERNDENNENND